MPAPPFISIRRLEDGTFTVEGTPSSRLGHVIPREPLSARSRVGDHDQADEWPDGIFVEWHWDGSTLTVRNDRYGHRPFFWFADATRFIGSPSLIRVVERGASVEIDRDALATFMHLGYFVNESTPLRTVRTLPSQALLRWDGTLSIESARSYGTPWPDAEPIDAEIAIDRYSTLFTQSISRRLPKGERFTVPLSGGRDSRHILLELVKQGAKPEVCVSSADMPPKVSVDIEPARRLCSALGIRLEIAPPPPRHRSEIRRTLLTSFCADEHEWMMTLADAMNGRFDTSYDGISGDTLSAPRLQSPEWVQLHAEGRFDELADRILGRDVARLMRCLPEEYRCASPRDTARADVAAALRRLEGAVNPIGMFNVYNRARREIALMSGSILGGVRNAYCPFLDHDLFDFLAGLPNHIRYMDGFHDQVIARLRPDLVHIPYAPKGRSMRAIGHFTAHGLSVLGDLVSQRPRWLRHMPTMLGQWGTFGVSRRRRATSRWLSPSRLLYFLQLDALRADPAAALAQLAREPAAGCGVEA